MFHHEHGVHNVFRVEHPKSKTILHREHVLKAKPRLNQ
jgi:hypothetical protein